MCQVLLILIIFLNKYNIWDAMSQPLYHLTDSRFNPIYLNIFNNVQTSFTQIKISNMITSTTLSKFHLGDRCCQTNKQCDGIFSLFLMIIDRSMFLKCFRNLVWKQDVRKSFYQILQLEMWIEVKWNENIRRNSWEIISSVSKSKICVISLSIS